MPLHHTNTEKIKGETFDDFRPISCCNMVYKIIAKIIAQCLKPIMSQFITEEQFGFLFNRNIHDAMALAQGALHSIKKEKQSDFALKIYLSKAYDRVSWTFIHLLLIKIGMPVEMVEWVLGCVQSTSFAVLINGSPSNFFRPTRGLRQGCPMSPFCFC